MNTCSKRYELLVVGGGPAGITLSKMLGKTMDMAVIRPEDHSMIYCAMPYALENIIPIEKTLKKDDLVLGAGATLIRSTAEEIDFGKKEVLLTDATRVGYEKLVLATGATPIIPNIPGSSLEGVMGFKVEDDLRALQSRISGGIKRAVVVGAGAIGIELAQALGAAGLTVDLVDMGDSILPNLIDRDMSEEPEEEIIRQGINLHLQAKVVRLEGDEYVNRVVLDNGREIQFDLPDECSEAGAEDRRGVVIFAVGMRTEVSLVKDKGIEVGRDGIIVNNAMETNVADVYAVGDCAQFTSGITCGVVPGKLATNAVPMAKILAFNLLGQKRKYPGFYNGSATKVGEYFIGGTGLSEKAANAAGYDVVSGYSEVTTQFPIMPGAKTMRTKLIAYRKSHKLLGGQIVSGEPVTGRIDLLTFAIQKESTIEELTGLSYSSQPYQAFFPAANGVVLAAEDILKKMVSEN